MFLYSKLLRPKQTNFEISVTLPSDIQFVFAEWVF